MTDYILEVNDLKQYYPIKGGVFQRKIGEVKAVDGISFVIEPGQTVGLVGESGCGKSSAGRTILQLQQAHSGEIKFCGQDITKLRRRALREARKGFQMVFQDPYASLNPMQMVGDIVGEPIRNYYHKKQRDIEDEVKDLLKRVGLNEADYYKYAHEFSGGQRQRVGIARALALKPKLIIADEPVSALDVSVQSQVLNIMAELQEEFGLSYLFIAHDLSVVKHVSDYICVMYLGHILEQGPAEAIYENPSHPYTKALISAIPEIDPRQRKERILLEGDLPSPSDPPSGCPFHTRCPVAEARCAEVKPPSVEVSANHYAACVLLENGGVAQ
ncbi:TPA: ATP-binding cassette domain-containing protein [Staphylococcus pseudintermedius]|uniref:ABC transporter ATP-binding protein n=1 Tax=Staphylococcus pseudintermedius TaxID=283734 RepID=UPI0019F6FD91|nr:oligopeptide/dipeptide ABC transporter ATP-binding protein [Staphylococcus pseudintermedius]EGQ1315898.1 ATP-binding cassette domain-containing protein [Staphylococcus pseudintermedius]EGQ1617599.1 ATP-binding cassette domain-containing protein [Staphylococcus pseudintermedius]EGQ3139727.1 ATP-binding cassette domain-containing protein [Staphylococcus pseudintermedius]EGQ3509306.1 ATP-binding cassette domain-containing protein [Staphylococcus pseudintermedius]EGQ3604107.1 ATP-binding casset